MTTQFFIRIASPIGALLLVSNGEALTALHMEQTRYPMELDEGAREDRKPFKSAIAQLDAYFAGELRDFDLPLAPQGTPFQSRVWKALQDIPFGETTSYGDLAAGVGDRKASRAVGLANGRNPIGIVVPCHRVIGANGSLTGYGGGMERKRWLLAHEKRVVEGI